MAVRTVYVALQQFCRESGEPRRILVEAGFDVRQNSKGRRLTREELEEEIRDADAVIAGVEPYDAKLLGCLPRLKCISRCGVGTDSIDLEAARRLGIAILTTSEEVVEPVAQMTVAMILALARNLPQHLVDFKQGLWRKSTGALLSEWTIGLVGFGRIGRAVERYLRPLGPKVIVTDPGVAPSQLPPGVEPCDLPALLSRSDLVSIHAARRPEEGPLIGRTELGLIKPGARLVNTARGYLVDESALLGALESGRLAAAALDVFETEPYTGRLAHLPQVLLTPHVASLTRASRAAMEIRCAANMVDFFRG